MLLCAHAVFNPLFCRNSSLFKMQIGETNVSPVMRFIQLLPFKHLDLPNASRGALGRRDHFLCPWNLSYLTPYRYTSEERCVFASARSCGGLLLPCLQNQTRVKTNNRMHVLLVSVCTTLVPFPAPSPRVRI